MSELQQFAEEARRYCEEQQQREFELEGACHENVIGTGDYIRYQTDYTPILVWGEVSHKDEEEAPDMIEEVTESETHFWIELVEKEGIIDVHTVNPLIGDTSSYITSGIAYGGERPTCYNPVEKYVYYGSITAYDLTSKEIFLDIRDLKGFERYEG